MTDTRSPWLRITDRIENFNTSGGSLLECLTVRDYAEMPKMPLFGRNEADMIEWVNSVAARSFREGMEAARDAVIGMDVPAEPPRLPKAPRERLCKDHDTGPGKRAIILDDDT